MTSTHLIPSPPTLHSPITYHSTSGPYLNRPTTMSFIKSSLPVLRSSSVRFASTATPTYVRNPLSATRKPASSATTTSRAALSSSKPAPAPAPVTDDAPPLPSFDDIDPPSRPSASSASRSAPTIRDAPSAPAPLSTFPDENYNSLPDAPGAPNTGGGWDTSFSGLSFQPFDKEVAEILLKEVTTAEVEVKPGTL